MPMRPRAAAWPAPVGVTQSGTPNSFQGVPSEVVSAIDVRRPLTDMEPNQRGFEITIAPPDIVNGASVGSRVETVVSARPNGCKDGEIICVTLGLVLDAAPNNSQTPIQAAFVHPMVRALIGFGIGSTSFEVACDWQLGTQVAIASEYFGYVKAQYLTNTLPWAPVPEPSAPSFRVAAALSYGATG